MAVVEIDTVIAEGKPGRRTPGEVEALLARMDVVLTNRLHGLVLAIKHGVPAVAVDSVKGGAKVRRQGDVLGWPAVLSGESLTDDELARAFEFCLSQHGQARASETRDRAMRAAAALEGSFLTALQRPPA